MLTDEEKANARALIVQGARAMNSEDAILVAAGLLAKLRQPEKPRDSEEQRLRQNAAVESARTAEDEQIPDS